MSSFLAVSILAQRGSGGGWNILFAVFVIGMGLVSWLVEQAKKKQRQQEAEQRARQRGRQTQERPPAAGSAQQTQAPAGTRQTEQMRRYQPQIPSAPGRARAEPGQRQPVEPEQSELIVVAQDVSAKAARERFLHEQQRERLRAEAVRQADIQDRRARQSRRQQRRAKEAAEKISQQKPESKPQAQPARPGAQDLVVGDMGMPGAGEISRKQIRQAIVWAEILAAPRAVRPLEQLF